MKRSELVLEINQLIKSLEFREVINGIVDDIPINKLESFRWELDDLLSEKVKARIKLLKQ